jgi:hypothetical protein
MLKKGMSVFKKLFNLILRLAFMAGVYVCFLLFFVPYLHTEIQNTLTTGLAGEKFQKNMPYAKCFRVSNPEAFAKHVQHSYQHTLRIGHCIRDEAEGYLNILKNG